MKKNLMNGEDSNKEQKCQFGNIVRKILGFKQKAVSFTSIKT